MIGSADPREARWMVPRGVKTVYAEIYDAKGKYVTRYTLTNYLDLPEGFTLRVLGR